MSIFNCNSIHITKHQLKMSLLIYSFPKQSFDFLDVINQKEYYRESYFIYHDPDLILQRCGIISTPIKSMTKPNTKLIVRLRVQPTTY